MVNIADYHIHLGYGNFRVEQRSEKYKGTILDNPYNNLLQYAGTGITYLRDGGDKDMASLKLKPEAESLGITLKSPGRAIVRRGCYGKYLGCPVDSLDDIKRELDFLLKAGVDHLKLVQSDIVAVNGEAQREEAFFDEKMLSLIMDCAKANQLEVMVHVNFPAAIQTVVDAGVTTVEHGYFMTEELLRQMKDKGIAWTPTLAPFANALTYDTWIPGWRREIVSEVVAAHKAMVKKAAAIGVRILAGSDGGSSICPHSRCTLDEHDILEELIPGKYQG